MDENKRIDQLTKQMPILERVPRAERIRVHRQAVRHPLFWGLFVGGLALWFYFFWDDIMASEVSDQLRGLRRKVAIFQAMFFPVLVPFIVFCSVLLVARYQLVKRIVKKTYGVPVKQGSSGDHPNAL